MIRRIFVACLASLMLFSSIGLCACDSGNSGDSKDEVTTTVANAGNTTTKPVEETSPYEEDDLPETFDFEDDSIDVLYWDDTEHAEFIAEDMTGSVVNDAIYQRNNVTETRLGVEINFIACNGNSKNINNFVNTVQKTDPDAVDVIASYSRTVAILATKGYLSDISDSTYINYDKPWWPKTLVEEATIEGGLYFVSGDISTNLLYMMYAIVMNKDLAEDHQIPNIYELIDNYEWTLDKLIELTTGVYYDDDADQKKGSGDKFGFVVSTIHTDPFWYGAGLTYVNHDKDGNLVIADSFGSEKEKAHDVINKMLKLCYGSNDGFYGNTGTMGRDIFAAGRSLFLSDRGPQVAEVKLRDADFKYTLLPTPMYNTAQKKYITTLAFPYTMYAIPSNASEGTRLMADAFIECMASESYRTVTPALFERVMKLQYADSDDDSRMYDIIREGVTFELGRIYCDDLGGYPYSLFRDSISGNSNTWSSVCQMKGQIMGAFLDALVANFQ